MELAHYAGTETDQMQMRLIDRSGQHEGNATRNSRYMVHHVSGDAWPAGQSLCWEVSPPVNLPRKPDFEG